jgi:hypothetical protein
LGAVIDDYTISTDTVAPTVSHNTIMLSVDADDNVAVAGVQFKLDGQNFGAEQTTAPYSTSINVSSLSTGSHSLWAEVRDGSGNTSILNSINFIK